MLGPLSLRLRLSRILTVIRSRIISVITAQPDVESAWPTFSRCIINGSYYFPALLRMILLCFRRSRNFSCPDGIVWKSKDLQFVRVWFQQIFTQSGKTRHAQFVHVEFCPRSFATHTHTDIPRYNARYYHSNVRSSLSDFRKLVKSDLLVEI